MTSLTREPRDAPQSWNQPSLTLPPANAYRLQQAKKGRGARACSTEQIDQLTRTIESEIIPRLLLANSITKPAPSAPGKNRGIQNQDVLNLVSAVVFQSLNDALAIANKIETQGVSRAEIFLDLLSPAARQLGDAWSDDTLSFVEVTIGLARLQQMLRELSPQFETETEGRRSTRSVLLLQATGEQHTFGLLMVELFFRCAGWDVVNAAHLSMLEAAQLLRRKHIDAVGISKSCSDLLETVASDITMLRRASRNKSVTVLVGGRAFDGHPERVILVGADASAKDGQQAVWQADKCVEAFEAR